MSYDYERRRVAQEAAAVLASDDIRRQLPAEDAGRPPVSNQPTAAAAAERSSATVPAQLSDGSGSKFAYQGAVSDEDTLQGTSFDPTDISSFEDSSAFSERVGARKAARSRKGGWVHFDDIVIMSIFDLVSSPSFVHVCLWMCCCHVYVCMCARVRSRMWPFWWIA